MASSLQILISSLLITILASSSAIAKSDMIVQRTISAPRRDIESTVIDGTGKEVGLHSLGVLFEGFDERKVGSNKVSVFTVAWLTLAMAAATGLGAVPFFFVELEPEWAGVCNGLAAGVMLAASFDLVQEGQSYGGCNLVVIGIISGAVFILLCKKVLERFGEVSMLDIKGANASKAILVIGIMTLHSFGEGSGVGVSFAGSKGVNQGLFVTLAIAVHNIPEGLAVSMVLASQGISPQNAMFWSFITSLPQPIVAVPSFLCADAFHKVLPFCTGFAAGCMIWMVIAEVLPDAFKEASPSKVASSGTLAVAFMETLSTVLQAFTGGNSLADTSGFIVSLLFGLGPFIGGIILINFSLFLHLPHPLLSGISSGISFLIAAWRPLQLLLSSKMSFFTLALLLAAGSAFFHVSMSTFLKFGRHKKSSVNDLQTSGLSLSMLTLQSIFACVAISLHAFAEGLALGVAAPKAHGLGRHLVLPVSLHGLPRGAAVASCIFGATDSWRGALAAAAMTGLAGPIAAICAILAGLDYNGLDHWMVFACGTLIPSFRIVFKRAMRLDKLKSIYGLSMGLGFACMCLMSTRLVCLHTPYCNSAPEAVT
ncbi:putative zinc transporter At3g08650 [Phalaenopsis equestris]|uniref:putative zinc transporter At3g08650 n=1 Tax=Phalaenopsis equestris TaxID=78828 RepID=UPI0009E5D130|nr:putative zinc transporter At3g08650 [Phalaenopsis equestris]XP_020581254.1 putative zinc transporter At3g08650 [Phalaenopsis equestris]XP_020581265.1 putative zinc transporter At3g08650 [Phalaenopsis equestris]XP_020581274.1 putative zinc transporter At3g08650 [Phalaenopsis equestris]XP_020581284.1 putative zinc transporter At3g08650 [Phalaenopsis equestris]XP_020581291.1 putative zinc transporter At3g08650 [Phalaenopsis equestris]XP_020581301.1 putative zinc transporter At3g08650 [Phalaen